MGGLTIDSTGIVTAQVNIFSYFISSDDYPVPVKHFKLHISIDDNCLSGYPPSPVYFISIQIRAHFLRIDRFLLECS